MTDSDTFMDLAVKAIQEIMKQHVVGSPKDQMAVVFYGAVSLRLDITDTHSILRTFSRQIC